MNIKQLELAVTKNAIIIVLLCTHQKLPIITLQLKK